MRSCGCSEILNRRGSAKIDLGVGQIGTRAGIVKALTRRSVPASTAGQCRTDLIKCDAGVSKTFAQTGDKDQSLALYESRRLPLRSQASCFSNNPVRTAQLSPNFA